MQHSINLQQRSDPNNDSWKSLQRTTHTCNRQAPSKGCWWIKKSREGRRKWPPMTGTSAISASITNPHTACVVSLSAGQSIFGIMCLMKSALNSQALSSLWSTLTSSSRSGKLSLLQPFTWHWSILCVISLMVACIRKKLPIARGNETWLVYCPRETR